MALPPKVALGMAPIRFSSGWNGPSVKPLPARLSLRRSSSLTGRKFSLCRRAPTCASLMRLELKMCVWLRL
ncbi:MAG: hypothetical protein DMF78_05560 [Acidobacteria bacterium]|nr:MAG: hypothetical protein DMF78_05560 [Acidobacteriota bacterium]